VQENSESKATVGVGTKGHPGHEIPRTKYQTKFTENRTEFSETKKFGSLFSSEFSGTEFTEVNTETEPNFLNLPEM
jgi:hypothetical protein